MKRYAKIMAGAVLAITGLVSFSGASQAYSGDYCREYTRTVYIGNQREEAYGTACLRPDGQWEIVNESDRMPVNYSPPIVQNRTVYVQQPAQIIYNNRRPTRVVFIGKPYKHAYYDHRRYGRYDRHDNRHDNGRHKGHR